MKHLFILTTIVLALITLTGCGGGNQAPQAAPNQAANLGQQGQGQQVQTNQEAVAPTTVERTRPTNTVVTNQTAPRNTNNDFKKMTDEQVNQKYDQLKQTNPTTAVRFGLQAWAVRFPEAASKKPADNEWSKGVMQRNRNQANTQGNATVQSQVVAQGTAIVQSQPAPAQKQTSAQDTTTAQKQTAAEEIPLIASAK